MAREWSQSFGTADLPQSLGDPENEFSRGQAASFIHALSSTATVEVITDGGRDAMDHYFHQVAKLQVAAPAADPGAPVPERSRS